MTRRIIAWGLLTVTLTGCAANGANQWPSRYSKSDATEEDLTADGTSCVPTSVKVVTAVGFVTLGIAWLVAGNLLADAKDHAECMAKRGWTVKWQE